MYLFKSTFPIQSIITTLHALSTIVYLPATTARGHGKATSSLVRRHRRVQQITVLVVVFVVDDRDITGVDRHACAPLPGHETVGATARTAAMRPGPAQGHRVFRQQSRARLGFPAASAFVDDVERGWQFVLDDETASRGAADAGAAAARENAARRVRPATAVLGEPSC